MTKVKWGQIRLSGNCVQCEKLLADPGTLFLDGGVLWRYCDLACFKEWILGRNIAGIGPTTDLINLPPTKVD